MSTVTENICYGLVINGLPYYLNWEANVPNVYKINKIQCNFMRFKLCFSRFDGGNKTYAFINGV